MLARQVEQREPEVHPAPSQRPQRHRQRRRRRRKEAAAGAEERQQKCAAERRRSSPRKGMAREAGRSVAGRVRPNPP